MPATEKSIPLSNIPHPDHREHPHLIQNELKVFLYLLQLISLLLFSTFSLLLSLHNIAFILLNKAILIDFKVNISDVLQITMYTKSLLYPNCKTYASNIMPNSNQKMNSINICSYHLIQNKWKIFKYKHIIQTSLWYYFLYFKTLNNPKSLIKWNKTFFFFSIPNPFLPFETDQIILMPFTFH